MNHRPFLFSLGLLGENVFRATGHVLLSKSFIVIYWIFEIWWVNKVFSENVRVSDSLVFCSTNYFG